MKGFLKGIIFAFEGINCFSKDRSLWKYVLIPWGLVFLFYAVTLWLVFIFSHALAHRLSVSLTKCPEFLRTLLENSLTVFSLVVTLIAAVTLLSTFFESFGSFFFEKLTERFEEKYFHTEFENVPLKRQILFTFQGMWYGVKSTLIFLLLSVLSFFFPLFIPLQVVIVGLRMAYTLSFTPGFLHDRDIHETMDEFRNRRLEAAGFGIVVYLLQLVPLLFPLLLPGMILGASMLRRGRVPGKEAPLK